MAATLVGGARSWSGGMDEEGHREYQATFLVVCAKTDGPATALACPGLPQPGQLWVIDNDVDLWAYCIPTKKIKQLSTDNGPNIAFEVECTFTTKPGKKCSDYKIENPLLEPQKISGSFTKLSTEASFDRFGQPMLSSSHEMLHGPELEVDFVRPTVEIEQNVPLLGLEIFAPMLNCLNSIPLWGMPPRTIKFANATWERKFHGQCFVYYTRKFTFEVSYTGFDKFLTDVGTKVLNGRWDRDTGVWVTTQIAGQDPDPTNPNHYMRFTDRRGNLTNAVLDGAGKPYSPSDNAIDTNCSDCPNGTRTNWRIAGAGDEVIISTAGACIWTGASDGPPVVNWVLSSASGLNWVLTRDDRPGEPYVHDLKGWRCMGPNVLYNDSRGEKVTLSAGSAPGAIGFSAYDSANFLLLGIPLIF